MKIFDRQHRHELFELVGILAIIASLVFVGYEVRQAREIARADIYQQRTFMEMDIIKSTFTNEALERAMERESSDHAAMTVAERAAWKAYMTLWFTVTENSHYQFENGLLTQEEWENQLDVFVAQSLRPCFAETWQSRRWLLRESFRALIDERMETEQSPVCEW